jgi:hypothetical protein
MKSTFRIRSMVLLVGVAMVVKTVPAQAQVGAVTGQIGPSKGEIVGIIVGVVAGAAVIGIVAYKVHKGPSITGCAVSNQSDLKLENEADHQTFVLAGDTANIKTGNRVRISGKKQKKDDSGNQVFVVKNLSKDYGSCKGLSVSP